MEQCRTLFMNAKYELDLCWVSAGSSGSTSLLGVSDYLASLALLLVIYTISDDRSKLRLMIAPVPVYSLIFWLFVCVFFFKVLVELWFYLGWPIFPFLDNKLLLDALLLTPSVVAIFIWMYLSYIRPPVFSRWNSQKFFRVYQRLIHNGTQEELRLALIELSRSAKSIIKSASTPPQYVKAPWKPSRTEGAAHNLLLLLGNRRLCAEMARRSPNTAAAFFQEISMQEKFGLPYHTFAQNVATALLSDKASPIFHEDSGWQSGWSGYAQIYSREIFTNPEHVTSLARRNSSPLDLRFAVREDWDSENWDAYTRLALLYFKRLIEQSSHQLDDISINQILENCKSMVSGVGNLNGAAEDAFFLSDEYGKLQLLSWFLRELIQLLEKQNVAIWSSLKPRGERCNGFHERLANLIFEVIFSSARVRHPARTCWHVTHNTIWSNTFNFNDCKTNDWIFRRVCRLIYDEIRKMDRYYNFRSAAYLGFCLNVLGLDNERHKSYYKRETPLRLAVLSWVQRNYCRMREESPKVAEVCLYGRIAFDEKNLEFVETFFNETSKTPSERRFKVDPL